jgi:hypothetical protein
VFVIDQDGVAAIVEISKQPTTGLTPPIVPLPPPAKAWIARLGFPLKPYISNLLVGDKWRRQVRQGA